MKDYVVTGQDVESNTEIKYEYAKDIDGNEYSNLVENKSIDTITLYVMKI